MTGFSIRALRPNEVQYLRAWTGYACEDANGVVIGIGAVTRKAPGEVWGVCHIGPELTGKGMLLHRLAVTMLARCAVAGETVFVLRDDSQPTSKRWLERLGFRPDGWRFKGLEVWKCQV